jgi:prefoldin subunit 5
MTERGMLKVDLNRSSQEILESVPGIGAVLAQRIIRGRPFDSVADLTRVQGIGDSFLERIESYFYISEKPLDIPHAVFVEGAEEVRRDVDIVPWDEPEPLSTELVYGVMEEKEGVFEEDPPKKKTPVESPKPEKPVEEPKKEKPLGRAEFIGYAAAVGLLTLIFSVLISLGVLALANGGLSYARSAQVEIVQRQIQNIEGQAENLQQDVVDLRTRLDNLEALSGRVNTIEMEVADLQLTVDETVLQVEGLSESVDLLSQDVGLMQEKVNVFDAFLDGLRQLLNQDMSVEVE